MKQLVALKTFEYGGKYIVTGKIFQAKSTADESVLVGMGRARIRKTKKKPEVKKQITTKKNTYNRRDMRAE